MAEAKPQSLRVKLQAVVIYPLDQDSGHVVPSAALPPRCQPMLRRMFFQSKTTCKPRATTPGVWPMLFLIERSTSEDNS
ncbi:hypothetical protein MJO29_009114 [Puccinia striiformis f. sp. tritici]|nr:hypothetical protein MJO29_009114 [Puccinia striiformis f. sp. tritici]